MDFIWDENKNKRNLKDHKVRFEDVIPVFLDEHAIAFEDDRFDYDDGQRMIIIGANKQGILYAAYAEIGNEAIRIISARPAEPREIKIYQQGY